MFNFLKNKTVMKTCLLFLALFFISISVKGQISVVSTAGIPTGNYTSLKASFDAINAGVHQGNILINVNTSVVETVTATLNASGGLSSYTAITIRPTTQCTISGKIAGALILLNGADSVMIDGRIGGIGTTQSLTLSNSYDSTVAAAYVVQFSNAANRNTIQYIICEGLGQEKFPNAAIVGQGSQYNKIDNCEIKPVGGGLLRSGIGSVDTVTNNLIHDFYGFPSTYNIIGSAGIGSCLFVKGNSLYHTDTILAPVLNYAVDFISGGNFVINNYIGGSAPLCGGNPLVYYSTNSNIFVRGISIFSNLSPLIDSNVISNIRVITSSPNFGYFQAIRYGTAGSNVPHAGALIKNNLVGSMTNTANIVIEGGSMAGIDVSGGAFVSKINIENNSMGGMVANSGLPSNYWLGGIFLSTFDSAIIKNNTIGGIAANSIRYAPEARDFCGITIEQAKKKSKIECHGNIIRNVSCKFSATGVNTLNGIYSSSIGNDSSHRWFYSNHIYNLFAQKNNGDVFLNGIVSTPSIGGSSVINNIIRHNDIHDLHLDSVGNNSMVTGINNESGYNLYLTIDSNKIQNLTNQSDNYDSNVGAAVQGIRVLSASNSTAKVANNLIRNLESKASTNTSVVGVNCFYSGTTPFSISVNRIYNLVNDSTSLGVIAGMKLGGGTTGVIRAYNNMITLKSDSANIYGICNSTTVSSVKLYYNSVAIKGAAYNNSVSGSFIRESYANSSVTLQNNIFQNERIGPNGKQYVLMNGNANPNTGWMYSNYNNFYDTNASSSVLWGNSDISFASYAGLSMRDSCSQNQFVYFVYPDTGDLHLLPSASHAALVGKSVSGISNDFDNDLRNPFPSMGADEQSLPFQGVSITASDSTLFCDGAGIILYASQNQHVKWLMNGFPIANANQDSIVIYQTGNYVLYYNDGCRSDTSNIITVNKVKINDSINQNGATLTALGQGRYKWFECSNFSVVLDTLQTFIPAQNGSYAVVVEWNECTDTSDCILVNSLSLNNIIRHQSVSIAPNPFTNSIYIQGVSPGDRIILTDMSSKQIAAWNAKGEKEIRRIDNLSPGYYIIKVISKEGYKVTNIPVLHQ